MKFSPRKSYRLSVYDKNECLATRTYSGFMDKSQMLWIAEGLATRFHGILYKVSVYCYSDRKSVVYSANGRVIK